MSRDVLDLLTTRCMPFTGTGGHAVGAALIFGCVVAYVLKYRHERRIYLSAVEAFEEKKKFHRSSSTAIESAIVGGFSERTHLISRDVSPETTDFPGDARSTKIFVFDIAKILIAMFFAILINMFIIANILFISDAKTTNDKSAAFNHVFKSLLASIDGMSWWAAVFLLDMAIGVPISIFFYRSLCGWCRFYIARENETVFTESIRGFSSKHRTNIFTMLCEQNTISGRYAPEGELSDDSKNFRFSWWLSQTFAWSFCVILSRLLVVVIAFYTIHNFERNCNSEIFVRDPFYMCYSHRGAYVVLSQNMSSTTATGVAELETNAWLAASSEIHSASLRGRNLRNPEMHIDFLIRNPVVGTAHVFQKINNVFDCQERQWVLGGGMRVVVDFLSLLLIDGVNKFSSKE